MFRLELYNDSGTLVSETTDINIDKSLRHELTYNEDIGFYTTTFPTIFKFHGSMYEYLFGLFTTYYCTKLTAKVFKRTQRLDELIYEGVLLLSDVSFDTIEGFAEVSLLNKGWQTKIENNWDLEVNLKAENTKNSTTGNSISLTPPTEIELCPFTFWVGNEPTPVTNALCKGYDLKDVFTHVVSYVSDNEITFESSWYDSLLVDKKILLTNGVMYRTGTGDAPFVTLKDLFEHIKKLCNVIIVFEIDTTSVVMRVENQSYLQSGTNIIVTELRGATITIDQNKLFNSVKVGSISSMQTNSEILPTYQFPILNGYSFKEDVFNIQTECNTQKQLDLSTSWVIDHNILQKSRTSEDNDGDIFLIQYNSETNCPVYGDPLGFSNLYNADYFYNMMFTNDQVLSRHSIYGDMVIHLQNGNNKFLACASNGQNENQEVFTYLNAVPVDGTYSEDEQKLRFRNDYTSTVLPDGSTVTAFDENNNYGNGTTQGNPVTLVDSIYTCPQTGYYKFESSFLYAIELKYFNSFACENILIRRNSLGVEIERKRVRHFGKVFSENAVLPSFGDTYPSGQQVSRTALLNTDDGLHTTPSIQNIDGTLFKTVFNFADKQTKTFYMEAGDTMEVAVHVMEYSNFTVQTQSEYPAYFYERPTGFGFASYNHIGGTFFVIKPQYFSCTETVNGGGGIITSKDQNAYIYNLTFDYLLTDAQVTDAINASSCVSSIDSTTFSCFGIVKNLTVNHKDNICKFVVQTNRIDVKQ